MYIWVGINVDSQLEELGTRVREIEKKLGYSNFCDTLPMHISLKISFPVSNANAEQVINDIKEIYRRTSLFEIEVSGIEIFEGIAWVRMKHTEQLISLSNELNSMLLSRHGVPLHEYDTDYKFHSTLFMGKDNEVREEFSMLEDISIPEKLTANRFVIGFSDSGELGTYSVLDEITL